MIDRRTFILASAALTMACADAPAGSPGPARREADPESPDFSALRERLGPGGRLGVAALDTGTGRMIAHDPHSRYAMASTFKVVLAGAILAEVDRGALALDREIPFAPSDILPTSPVTEAHLSRGRLPVERLARAIVEVSDNAAANLLLARIGGPAGLTRFIRRCGDGTTRIDRLEMALNSNLPEDPRDTTTPAAMLGLLHSLLLGDVLSAAGRARLAAWMEGATTGLDRLRAGLPAGWRAGDKTGTGANGAANDVAIAWPPGRRPILIVCYQSGGTADLATRKAVQASVAHMVAAALA